MTASTTEIAGLRCAAQIPVADLDRGRDWYARHLELEPMLELADELHFQCGGGTLFTLYRSASAGASEQTVMAWLTRDLDAVVGALRERGVTFEAYDLPGLVTGPDGIAQLGADRAAWFRDSEGNVLAVAQSGIGLLDELERTRD